MLICQYCGKECKNSNSLKNHERVCKNNPDRALTTYEKFGPIKGFNDKGRISNRKGLKKETDESIQRMLETRRLNHEQGKFEYHRTQHSEQTKQRLSEVAKERGLGGTNYKSIITYNGVKLDSSYELEVARSLDENDVKWLRPSRFKYTDSKGINHTYTPDFYLTEYDVYLDPKNDYLIENVNPWLGYSDVEKIDLVQSQNNIKVIILNKDNLTWDKIKQLICGSSSVG